MSGQPEKEDDPIPFPAQTIESLNEQLSSSSLRSSSRILILILLAMNKKLTAGERRSLTRLGKGSLENHLEKLESAGYVKTKNIKSFSGWRQNVEITPEGLEGCRTLLRSIRALAV